MSKDKVGKVYFFKSHSLPTFFKILESTRKKVNGKFDHFLLVDRFILKANVVEKLDTYNMWYNYNIKGVMKEVTPDILKAVKKKYRIKKGLHKIRSNDE